MGPTHFCLPKSDPHRGESPSPNVHVIYFCVNCTVVREHITFVIKIYRNCHASIHGSTYGSIHGSIYASIHGSTHGFDPWIDP